jgi:8-oxo-dGTP diphosphatase
MVRRAPREDGSVRDWVVGGAVIETGEGLLLVCNRRRDGSEDWTPPGGVIDDGEHLLEGLTREVQEETGITVERWSGPLYEVVVEAAGLGWRLRVEAWRAEVFAGDLVVGADPDGFVAPADCPECLGEVHVWVREPLGQWLEQRWEDTRRFHYDVAGHDRANLVVTRR